MNRIIVLCSLLLVASVATADRWRSIDGFTILTDAGVEITDSDDPVVGTIRFAIDGAEEPDVLAHFAPRDGFLRRSDIEIVHAVISVRTLPSSPDDRIESITASPYITPPGVEGTWVTIRSSSGYHDAFVVPIDPPGRTFWAITFVPHSSGDEGRRHLDRVLEELKIVIEEAAG